LHRSAPFYVVPCLAVGTVALAFSFAKREWNTDAAVLGAALVATSPLFFNEALQPMSDVPAAFWMLLATMMAWRRPEPRPMVWGIAGGMATLTRPPLLLAVIVAAAIAGWRKREILTGGAVLSVFVCALLAAQWHMYGNPLVSGHGGGTQLFTLAAVPHNLVAQAKWLMITHTPLTIPAFLLAFRAQRQAAVRSLLVFLAVTAPYLFYSVRFDDWEMNRFLLPGWLLVLITCAGGIVSVVRGSSVKARLVTSGVAVAAAAGSLLFLSTHHALDYWQQEMKYPLVGSWLRTNTSTNAVFIASLHSGSIKFYTGRPTLRMEGIPSEAMLGTIEALERANFTPIVVLEPGSETHSFFDTLGGNAGLSYWPLASVRGTTIMRLSAGSRANQ
jgi:4-amino-4-deoxy-L-arabinose transferase-like glycosyltransferase